jgi:hypothetical protein
VLGRASAAVGLILLLLALAALVTGRVRLNGGVPHPARQRVGRTHAVGRGRATPPSAASLRPRGAYAVVIENSPAARPQSGLDRAKLVFEAPAEGGITRFMAVFWGGAVPVIGPVRSTRIYFDRLARMYRLPLAHAGGNVDAKRALKSWHLPNLDALGSAAAYFWRSTARLAPHNLYTSSARLRAGMEALGVPLGPVPTFPPGHLTSGAPTPRLAITFADDPGVFVERPIWELEHGRYVRTEDGAPDPAADGRPVVAKTVIVIVAPESADPDPYTPGAVKFALSGSGPGFAVEDGLRQAIVWHGSPTAPFRFTLAQSGRPLPVPAGPVWIEIVGYASEVSFG